MDRVIEAIRERRAVRSYTQVPVDEATIDQLLDAATRAPSAVNAQPWSVGVIQDRARIDRYAERTKEIYLTDPPVAEISTSPTPLLQQLRHVLAQPGYHVFHGAGTLITIYATTPDGIPDCFLAGENLMPAAHAVGLGTCPIGLSLPLMNQAEVKNELGVPLTVVAALPIVVGYPAERPQPTPRSPPRILYRC